MRIRLGLSNYRCFPDSTQTVITIEPGFTSFVGVNNAGKSTLLRSLYEFRTFFTQLSSASNMYTAGGNQTGPVQFPLFGVNDADDVFTDTNGRDMKISLAVEEPSPSIVGHPVPDNISFTVSRDLKSFTTEMTVEGVPERRPSAWTQTGGVTVLQLADGIACDLAPYFEAFNLLSRTLYLGAFRNALNVGQGDAYYDLVVGQRFIGTWNNFKTGAQKKSREAALTVERELGQIFRLRDLDLSASADGKSLMVATGDKSYRLEELGAGFAQFVIVLAYVATQGPTIVLIDEPELSLHPALQLEFLTTLGELAEFGVLFATHQLGLARAAADRVYTVRRIQQGEAEVRLFEGTPRLGELLGELNFAGYQDLGYTTVLLVEGPSELRTLQVLLRRYRAEHRVVLVPLAGGQMVKGDVQPELQEVKRLSSRVFALIDSEKASAEAGLTVDRQGFADACKDAGIDCHVLARRAIENYFSGRAVQAIKGENWRALEPYELPKDSGMSWSKTRDNWRIATEMTREELDGSDLGEFLERIAAASEPDKDGTSG